jgi:hypothetical protein
MATYFRLPHVEYQPAASNIGKREAKLVTNESAELLGL